MSTRTRKTFRVNKDSWMDLRDILKADEDFNPDSATLRGRKVTPDSDVTYGRLPEEIRNLLGYSIESGNIDYVIYSYQTPIAVRWTSGVWSEIDLKYSVTTSKHQGKVATAISQL